MDFNAIFSTIDATLHYKVRGKLLKSYGLIYEASLPLARLGSHCKILPHVSTPLEQGLDAEVIGFKGNIAVIMPFDQVIDVGHESVVVLLESLSSVVVGDHLLGRIIDAKGEPLDKQGSFVKKVGSYRTVPLHTSPTDPLERSLVKEPLDVGVRSINGLLSLGKGQRVGIMAGSGVGKSILLGMMAKNTTAQINVIALVGERGREVGEFVANELTPEVMQRTVVVVATSDQSALLRVRAAYLATTIAEYFRSQCLDVLLLMDSVTRFCMAQREIGLSLGEPPTSKGYTPSVFSILPKLLERAGTSHHGGSITGIYTVLVDGDDFDEPIADAVRGILDGHIVLTRKLAHQGHFPAVDILQSVSRVMHKIASPEHVRMAMRLREMLATYAQVEDLIQIGSYVKGAQPKVDQAVLAYDRICSFLKQSYEEKYSYEQTLLEMMAILRFAEAST